MTQYGGWTSARIRGGGYMQQIVLCPSDPARLYTWSDIGGIARSDDGGDTWRFVHGGLPAVAGANEVRGLLVDPRDADRLMAAVGGLWGEPLGLFLSPDGGASWELRQPAPFFGNGPRRWEGQVLARSVQSPDDVLAASAGGGVWRSTDGGRTWTSAGLEGLYPSDLKWDRKGKRVWLCCHPAVVRGREFAGGLFRSEDAGLTWARLADAAPDELVQDPVDGDALVGIFDASRLARSRDAGATWETYHEGLPDGPGPGAEVVSERRFQALAAGPDWVLTGSSRGTVWKRGYRAPRWERVEPEAVEAGDWWGAFRGQLGEWRHFGAGLSSLTVDPRDPACWWRTDWYAAYRSRDAGTRWKLCIAGLEGTFVHALARDAADPRIVHAGLADNGYFRSTDGGRTFAQVVLPGGGNNIRSLATSGKDPRRLYAAGSRGYDWASNQVWRSDDAGASWNRVPGDGLPDPDRHACVSVAAAWWDPDEVFAAVSGAVEPGGGGVYWSADGGTHWVWTGDGLPAGEACFRDAIFDGRGSELAAGRSGALLAVSKRVPGVWRADRPGAPWVRMDAAAPGAGAPVAICRDPHRDGVWFLCVQAGGLFVSRDDGRTWTRLLDRPVTTVAADETTAGVLAVGMADGVALSRDDGATWTEAGTGLPNRMHPVVGFADGGLLAGTGGNGVFRSDL